MNKRSTQVKVLFLLLEMVLPSFILTKNQWTLIKQKLNPIWLDGQLHGDVNKRNWKLLVNVRLKDIRKLKNLEIFLVFLKQTSEKQEQHSPLERAKPRNQDKRIRIGGNNTLVVGTNKVLPSPTKVQEDDSWYCYWHYSSYYKFKQTIILTW